MWAFIESWSQTRMRKQTNKTTTTKHKPKQNGANKLVFKLCIMVQKRKNHKIKQISPLNPILCSKVSVVSKRHDGQISI